MQGVGFRFTAERIAASLALTGWVKNLKDGRVEIFCEGKETDLNEFLKKIADIFRGYILDCDLQWGEAKDEFIGFDIRF